MGVHQKTALFLTLLAIVSIVGTTKQPDFQWQETHEPYLPPIRIIHTNNT